jgi:hypothetical protein
MTGANADELAITRTTPEWCAAETGGVVVLLVLTSVRTAWLTQMGEFIRDAAERHEHGHAALLSVFRLDKRYPLDIGFDANFPELRESLGRIAPSLGASSMVLEFGGVIAFTMKAAARSMALLARTKYPRAVHSSVVSGASWIRPYANASERRDVGHYVRAIDRMKMELGCELG